jgi:peptide-methionine (R)-S-oxide reductase
MKMFLATLTFAIGLAACGTPDTVPVKESTSDTTMTMSDSTKKLPATDAEWKAELTPTQYHILREKGTERAFTGEYWNNHEHGVYKCAGCDAVLFSSEEKFDSGCGWPSFSLPWDSTAVNYHDDNTYGMKRTEVTCKKCGGHLGHVFDDGPPPTNLRYCINSGAMVFVKQE